MANAKAQTINSENAILSGISGTKEITVSFNAEAKDAGRSHEIEVNVDFTGCTVQEVKEWAMRDRIIALQRALRQFDSEEELEAFANQEGGVTVPAKEAGHKPDQVLTPEQRKAQTFGMAAQLSEEDKAELRALLEEQEAAK